jgi:hypothetical protein
MGKGIPAGYQLLITSWENDGDNYNTKIVSGLTEEDVACYLEILNLFKSCSRGGFANEVDDNGEEAAKAISAVLEKHPNASKATIERFTFGESEYIGDHARDAMYDLLGCSEHYGFRVFDRATVYYFETPVKDVTKKFV